MKLARYWARDQGEAVNAQGQRVRAVARGWSDESVDAARARAREIAGRVAQRILTHPGDRNQYQYGDRPLPEPVVREFSDAAKVTRNAYGALVLNTDNLMFVDIDRQDANGVMALVKGVAERHDFSARVYQTAAGYRALIANASLEAATPATEALLNEFGADSMYVRLCRLQQSFRARLTPKPWRCGFGKPPVNFPFETPQAEAQFRRWEAEYNAKAAPYATCRYLSTFGGIRIAGTFEEQIFYHDQETKASSNLPLA